MNPIAAHPALAARRRTAFAPMRDVDKLAMHLRHLLSLDRTAVYNEVGGSTIVYYVSGNASYGPGEMCTRIVLAPNGDRRRIGRVGFDPRTRVSA